MRARFSTQSDAGYAAADALVALMILALTIVTSLSAVAQGRRLTRAALETRQAQALSRHLLAVTPLNREPGQIVGRSAGFAWTMTVDEPVRAYGAATLCQRRMRMESLATARVYAASTAEICPNDDYEE